MVFQTILIKDLEMREFYLEEYKKEVSVAFKYISWILIIGFCVFVFRKTKYKQEK